MRVSRAERYARDTWINSAIRELVKQVSDGQAGVLPCPAGVLPISRNYGYKRQFTRSWAGAEANGLEA